MCSYNNVLFIKKNIYILICDISRYVLIIIGLKFWPHVAKGFLIMRRGNLKNNFTYHTSQLQIFYKFIEFLIYLIEGKNKTEQSCARAFFDRFEKKVTIVHERTSRWTGNMNMRDFAVTSQTFDIL